jgi:hypothetical protein
MKNTVLRALLAVLATAAGVALAQPTAAPPPDRPLRVLFIGNSMTYDNGMPNTLASLAAGFGPRAIEVAEATLPAATLKRHWEGRARDRLKEGWDYVVLQPRSADGPDEYVRLFDAEIRAAGAKTVLFNTWLRKSQDDRRPAMDASYARVAGELGAILAPVGPAWDKFAAKHGASTLYARDNHHASPTGSYVAACVFYSAIFGKPLPPGDEAGSTRSAHEVAWEVVRRAVK